MRTSSLLWKLVVSLTPMMVFAEGATNDLAMNSKGQDRESFLLANGKISASISAIGALLSIENRISSESYSFADDGFAIDTNAGTFSSDKTSPLTVSCSPGRVSFKFEFPSMNSGKVFIELAYALEGENGFLCRTVRLKSASPLRLERLSMGRTSLATPSDEAIHYLTFWQTPTVEFLRFQKGGIFTGIENPFYNADIDTKGFRLSFETGLILKANEEYLSEAQFIGVYKKSGIMIEDCGRPFRFPNASGYIPIDRNESRAMRAFALDCLKPEQSKLLNINYQFFHPLPQMPADEKAKLYFTKAIDVFSGIGGDMIIFNPLHPYVKPDAKRDFWNVIPDESSSIAKQITDYAASKGISYGFYMGCAAHGNEGNAAGLNFRPDKPEWKKMDEEGHRAPDNCLASDGFYEWWLHVQDNTIKKYKLSNWSWDPSRGTGMNCYDESHGHIAGKGAYKGWRRCMELGKRLKESNPGLFIQAFYGTKQFGLWGLKYVDGHEVYNEQTACVSSHHTQISDDRQNADGLRFQNYWSMRFRFLPSVIGHPLVGRMNEGYWDPDLTKACDFYGWKYSLMSALAISGSVMPSILPYESDLLPGYTEFYDKWLAWGKRNFDYVPFTEPFGEQVLPGGVDGYARIRGNHGFVFLFNGNPRPSRIEFEVGDEINLQEKGNYEFTELYPSEDGDTLLDSNGNSMFTFGGKASIIIPSNACKLLELRPTKEDGNPTLVGIPGVASLKDGRLEISGTKGKPGQVYPASVRLPASAKVESLLVNGIERKFNRQNSEITFDVQFAGEEFVRELDDWSYSNGERFRFANGNAIEISTKFHMRKDIPVLLDKARAKNYAEIDAKVGEWEKSYKYHNYACCRPWRLWLVIPFALHEYPDIKIYINGKDCTDLLKKDYCRHSLFLDATDLLKYGDDNEVIISMRNLVANDFMGPFLMYPEEPNTVETLSRSAPLDENRVVFSGSLIQPNPPRFLTGSKAPEITQAYAVGKVTLSKPTKLVAKVNLPSDQIQSVMFTESGFPWMSIGRMSYDKSLDCWTADLVPGDRGKIQENEFVYVWAEAKNGLHSDYKPVKIGWSFVK